MNHQGNYYPQQQNPSYNHNMNKSMAQQPPNDFASSNNFNGAFGGPKLVPSSGIVQSPSKSQYDPSSSHMYPPRTMTQPPPPSFTHHQHQQQQQSSTFMQPTESHIQYNVSQTESMQTSNANNSDNHEASIDVNVLDDKKSTIEDGLSHEELDIYTCCINLTKTMTLAEFFSTEEVEISITSDQLKNEYFVQQIKDTDKAFLSTNDESSKIDTNHENIFIIDTKIQNAQNSFPFPLSVVVLGTIDGKKNSILPCFNQSTRNDHKRKCMTTIPVSNSVLPPYYAVLDSEKVYASQLFKYFGHTDINYFIDKHIIVPQNQKKNHLNRIYVKKNSQLNKMISDNVERLKKLYSTWDGKVKIIPVDNEIYVEYPSDVATQILAEYKKNINSRIDKKRLNAENNITFKMTYDKPDHEILSTSQQDNGLITKSAHEKLKIHGDRVVSFFFTMRIRYVFPMSREIESRKDVGKATTNFAQKFQDKLQQLTMK
jgi:hypothetical protein